MSGLVAIVAIVIIGVIAYFAVQTFRGTQTDSDSDDMDINLDIDEADLGGDSSPAN